MGLALIMGLLAWPCFERVARQNMLLSSLKTTVSACLGHHESGKGHLLYSNGLWMPMAVTDDGFAFTLPLLFQAAVRSWLSCSATVPVTVLCSLKGGGCSL